MDHPKPNSLSFTERIDFPTNFADVIVYVHYFMNIHVNLMILRKIIESRFLVHFKILNKYISLKG